MLAFEDYPKLLTSLAELSLSEARAHCRNLCRTDLYFLLRYVFNRPDMERKWLFDRCREVQLDPDNHLDLWARDHYKSTIITYGKTIQDLLASHGDDPLPEWNGMELTVGIFSHTRPIAKGFLRQIKRELESNKKLLEWFPDVLWANPKFDAPKWSEDDGIILRRKTNPKEASVEAWGVVDGQPISKHFGLLNYDDIVTRESVNTPDQISKTTEMLELSYNLGTDGGKRRFIGTRYHFNDSYKPIMERGTAKARIYAATEDGTVEGEPVLLDKDSLFKKRRDMGPYTFACFVAGTRILLADWTERPIEQLKEGDIVVGYTFGDGKKAKLEPSQIVATNTRMAEVVRLVFESGRSVVCTPDHKFWHGRAKRAYAPIGFGYGEIKGACEIYNPDECSIGDVPEWAKGYIGGFFDGEGCVTGKAFHFAQDFGKNQACCEALERALSSAKLPYSICNPKSRPQFNDYYLTGGRAQKIRFARVMKEFGKAARVQKALFDGGTRNIGKGVRDRLVEVQVLGQQQVFNIQTTTGNYVAEGYATKNCQMLQNPVADSFQGFKREWLQYHDGVINNSTMNKYIIIDPANSKKASADFTSIWVLGYSGDDNVYVLDMVRDRLNLTERCRKVIELHRKYQPVRQGGVRYEQYGLQADIEHLQSVMATENYRFEVQAMGGSMPKNDRIRRLIPWFEQGRIYLPRSLHVTASYDQRVHDLTHDFIEEEYLAFPVPVHDDMLDSLARLAEPDYPLIKPTVAKPLQPVYANRQGSWMG